jgi:hypothetical protein
MFEDIRGVKTPFGDAVVKGPKVAKPSPKK